MPGRVVGGRQADRKAARGGDRHLRLSERAVVGGKVPHESLHRPVAGAAQERVAGHGAAEAHRFAGVGSVRLAVDVGFHDLVAGGARLPARRVPEGTGVAHVARGERHARAAREVGPQVGHRPGAADRGLERAAGHVKHVHVASGHRGAVDRERHRRGDRQRLQAHGLRHVAPHRHGPADGDGNVVQIRGTDGCQVQRAAGIHGDRAGRQPPRVGHPQRAGLDLRRAGVGVDGVEDHRAAARLG